MHGVSILILNLVVEKYCKKFLKRTVGQLSHATHKDEKLSHPVDRRDLGYRPRSGLWQRKDGYCGRKIHPPKPIKVINAPSMQARTETSRKIKFTYSNWSLTE